MARKSKTVKKRPCAFRQSSDMFRIFRRWLKDILAISRAWPTLPELPIFITCLWSLASKAELKLAAVRMFWNAAQISFFVRKLLQVRPDIKAVGIQTEMTINKAFGLNWPVSRDDFDSFENCSALTGCVRSKELLASSFSSSKNYDYYSRSSGRQKVKQR